LGKIQQVNAMNLPALVSGVLLATALTSHSAVSEEPAPQSLKCDIGPVAKIYGRTQWLVYSCTDNRTLVVISAPGNPATPFYFTFYPHENGYQLSGEGTGRKDVTNAAFNELKALSGTDIVAILCKA
jgi:hypothetical protein